MHILKWDGFKRLLSDPAGPWQKILLDNLYNFGGERLLYLSNIKIKEVAAKLSNPFWKDVFICFGKARPITKMCIQEILSLDILNFVPVDEFLFYSRWENKGVKYLYNIVNPTTRDFYDFAQLRDRLVSNNFMKYYSLRSRIPKNYRDFIKENVHNVCLENFCAEDTFLKSILNVKKAKFVYRALRDNTFYAPTDKFEKWEDKTSL